MREELLRVGQDRAKRIQRRILAALHHARHRRSRRRLLIYRDHLGLPGYNKHFLAWVRAHHPELWGRFELRYHPGPVRDLGDVALFVPWLQDPLREEYPRTFRAAREIERRCAERGIPVVNPVATLSQSIKSRAAEVIRRTGLRTPRMVPISDPASFARDQGGLEPPFFIREDRVHGGPMILVRDLDDLAGAHIERLANPVAVEFIDVRSPDGLHRKWRYLAIGERGVPRHLVASRNWVVHAPDRVLDADTRAAELAYTCSRVDPNHEALQRARRALGFDFVAFDYSYDREGRIVVWEPNPFPSLVARYNLERADLRYQFPAIERVYRALLQFLLERADGSTFFTRSSHAPRHGEAAPRRS